MKFVMRLKLHNLFKKFRILNINIKHFTKGINKKELNIVN